MGELGQRPSTNSRVAFEVTSEPWTLPIDAIVVSVGATFGELGTALASQFPDAPWPTRFDEITPGLPQRVLLRDRRVAKQPGPWLAILATPHGPDADPTVDTIAEASAAAVRAADDAGAKSIGMPMLATGVLGIDVSAVATLAVPATIEAATNSAVRRVTFLTKHGADVPILRTAAEGRLPIPTRLRPRQQAHKAFDLAGGVSADRVDPNIGIPLRKDQLGVAPYVSMLATVIADRKTPTPLSVGIFGEWGSGKSYFMGLLRNTIGELARSGNPAYHTEIAQIGFNAWHYADSNLWASLGDEIFRQLAEPGLQPKDQRRQLRTELAQRLGHRRELDVKTQRARETAATLQAQVDAAMEARRDRAADLITALSESTELRHQLNSLWRKLGVSEPVEQSKLLADELNGTLSEVEALRRAATERIGKWIVPTAALALAACAVIAALAPGLRSWLAATSGVLAMVFAAGISLLTRARSGLRALRSLSDDLRSGMKRAARHNMTARAIHTLEALRTAEAEQRVAEAQLRDVVSHIGELGRQLSELAPDQRLYSFLASRAENGSYHRNLGLISMIRKDFEQLVALMADWRAHPDADDTRRPIDRIVLYIDDLDRCSPRQVVEVLQAVHLLLALDLFIVVIGVDPRWLLRSLRSHYHNILDEAADTTELAPCHMIPEGYLEKIINLPIVLPGMPTGSLNRLLLAIDTEQANTVGLANKSITQRLATDPHPLPAGGLIGIEAGSEVDEQHHATALNAPRPLTEPELTLLSTLDVLVETPREAKRLFNIYRMIRATRDLSDASRFLGEDGKPGEYQAVVVLLGLLTTHTRLLKQMLDTPPDLANDVAGGLLHRSPDDDWHRFVADSGPIDGRNRIIGTLPEESVANWARLNGGLARVSAMVTLPDVSACQQWAPRIRRFSYNLMR